jgi:hypothetical protein
MDFNSPTLPRWLYVLLAVAAAIVVTVVLLLVLPA